MRARRLHRTATATLLLALLAGSATAAENQAGEGQRAAPELGAAVGKQINDAIELLNNHDTGGAKAAIDKLKLNTLSAYERSRVEQIKAAVDNGANNYAGATQHLGAALKAGGLSSEEALQVRFQLGQLLLAQEQWPAGAAALEEWFKVAPSPNASAYYLLAMAYYQQNDYAHALAPAEKALQTAGDKAQDSWRQLLLAVYLNLQKWDKAAPLLVAQVRDTPDDKAGWLQLASLYAQQQQYDRALVIAELAEHAGLLTEHDELLRLAEQMMQARNPHRAATFLDGAIAQKRLPADAPTYQKLGSAWLAAREYARAIEPLQRAFELSGDANIALRIGEIELQRNDWAAAERAVQRALAGAGLKDKAGAALSLGIALYNQNKLTQARGAFETAVQAPEQRQYARSYLQAITARAGHQ